MKKQLFAILLILLILCGCSQDIDIANIPFEILDKGDFTIDELSEKIDEPLLIAIDDQEKLNAAYTNISKNEATKDISVNEDTELVALVFRGNQGSCDNADISVKKVSRENDVLKIEVEIDKNIEAEIKTCPLAMNPYSIIKFKKEDLQFEKGLKIALIDKGQEKPLMATEINKVPGYLK